MFLGAATYTHAFARRTVRTMPSGFAAALLSRNADNGFGGVIFHEACGHGLEATSVAKGLSVFSGKIGQQIASPIVTAIDDGSIPGEWGSFNIDDEGTKSQRNVLIENGILKGYMIDKLNARRMKMAREAAIAFLNFIECTLRVLFFMI